MGLNIFELDIPLVMPKATNPHSKSSVKLNIPIYNNSMRRAHLSDINEAQKPKSAYKICTSSVGRTAGTKKRSEWSKSELDKYERCLADVAPKIGGRRKLRALHPSPPKKRGGDSPRQLKGDPRTGSNMQRFKHDDKP